MRIQRIALLVVFVTFPTASLAAKADDVIKMPKPKLVGSMSLEETIQKRRSIRRYAPDPLRLDQVSQLLWSAQGITDQSGKRASPSAGAQYYLETYLIAGKVEGLPAGIYRYVPEGHRLIRIASGDLRSALAEACLGQRWVKEGPASIVFAAIGSKLKKRYGERGVRFVDMEAGHAGQNLYLQATALGLGTVAIGAFREDEVRGLLHIPDNEIPIYLFPFGKLP